MTERKDGERRVGLLPEGVAILVAAGHEVLVEAGAGLAAGATDAEHAAAGASVVADAAEVWARAGLVVKVKEPVAAEYGWLHEGAALFSFLNLAHDEALTRRLLAARVTSIAYELVRTGDGVLPILAPMSQVAGRMAAEVGAHLLRQPGPGRGKLLGGVDGGPPGRAIVVGAGVAGTAAALALVALGAEVTVFGRDLGRLEALAQALGDGLPSSANQGVGFRGRPLTPPLLLPGKDGARGLTLLPSTPESLAAAVRGADLAVLALLDRAGPAERVLTRAMVRSMGPGAVIVDVCIDQGGAAETSRPTSHSDPIYVDEGVVHYCVPNMPGAVPQTSARALAAASLPYVLALAEAGAVPALRREPALALGLSTYGGALYREPVGRALGLPVAANPFLP